MSYLNGLSIMINYKGTVINNNASEMTWQNLLGIQNKSFTYLYFPNNLIHLPQQSFKTFVDPIQDGLFGAAHGWGGQNLPPSP